MRSIERPDVVLVSGIKHEISKQSKPLFARALYRALYGLADQTIPTNSSGEIKAATQVQSVGNCRPLDIPPANDAAPTNPGVRTKYQVQLMR